MKTVKTSGKKQIVVPQHSSLKDVGGMLHRPGPKKLSEKQLTQQIASHLRKEDRISKA